MPRPEAAQPRLPSGLACDKADNRKLNGRCNDPLALQGPL